MSPPRHTARGLALWVLAGSLLGASALPAQQQPEPRPITVDSVVVRGNERVSDAEIINRSQLRNGTAVTYPDIQQVIRRLYATGNFSDVRVSVTPGDPAIFHLAVDERPFVDRYDFVGLTAVSAGTLRDSAGLVGRAPLSPGRVTRARSLLRRMLANEGFPRPRIDTAMVGTRRGYRVVFRVEEGPRLGLARITFEGNEAFQEGRLREVMETGEEGFFWFRSGQLKEEVYEKDLTQRLPDFYAAHGYLDFAVTGDTVVVDTATGKGRLVVRVEEGPQYRLAEFEIRGNRHFSSERLRSLLGQLRGRELEGSSPTALRPFDETDFRAATSRISDLYRNEGYLRAQVAPVVEKLPTEDGEGHRLVRAGWQIQEGEPAYVRQVRIVGNDFTHDRVIRQRLTVFPGDIYSQQRLINSIQRIMSLGFFERLPPQEMVQIEPRPDGDVDITVRVQEKSTGNVNFGMSASAATGFAGFVGYEQPNLFGQAKQGSFRVLWGGRTQDIEVNYSDPEVFGTRYSATVGLRSARDRFRTFSLGERRQTGGFLEIGRAFPGLRSTRIFVGYSLFRDEVSDLRLFGVTPEQRQLLTEGTRSTVTLRMVRDTRQGGLFPTEGNRNAVSARFSGGPFGGDGDFSKWQFESEWHLPVAQIGGGLESLPIEFVGNLSLEGGFIFGRNPFFRERFFMGGTQIGTQLRGYEEATITPSGHIPRRARFSQLDRVGESYFATSASLGVKITGNIFASTFVDAGNVWASPSAFNPSDVFTGAGVGVSLVTPFGPLGVDYAYGFNRRDVLGRPDPGWKLHFRFGRAF